MRAMVVALRHVLGPCRHQMAAVDDQGLVQQVAADSSGGCFLSDKPDQLVAQRGLSPTVRAVPGVLWRAKIRSRSTRCFSDRVRLRVDTH